MQLLQSHAASLVWVPVIAGLVWMLAPLLLFWSPLREVEKRPLALVPLLADPEQEQRVDEFRARGFRPVGWMRERCWFFTPLHWVFTSNPEAWLASADGKVHVNVYRSPLGHRPIRVAAYTAFAGGGLLATGTAPATDTSGVGQRHRFVEIRDRGLDDLIAAHQQNVRDFCEQRGLRERAASLADVAAEWPALVAPFAARARFLLLYPVALVGALPALAALWPLPLRAAPVVHASLCLLAVALFAHLRTSVLPEYQSR
jgi:hypothetical protein